MGLNDDPDTNKTISIIPLSNFSPFILDARSELKMYKGHRDKGTAEEGSRVGGRGSGGTKMETTLLEQQKKKEKNCFRFWEENVCVREILF